MEPDTVRMMLSGNADLEAAMSAINDSNIFRILAKPCPDDVLVPALEAGIEQYRLVKSERELLEQTLKGSVKTLTEVLALANPELFGRAMHVQHYVRPVLNQFDEPVEAWPIEVAVMLSQIGSIQLPDELIRKLCTGAPMTREEKAEVARLPLLSEQLLGNIPRLEPVREILKTMGGSDSAPWGARLLDILFEFELRRVDGKLARDVVSELRAEGSRFDAAILELFERALEKVEKDSDVRDLALRDLRVGMQLLDPVTSKDGRMLVAGGQEITASLLDRLSGFARGAGVAEPVRVRVPPEQAE